MIYRTYECLDCQAVYEVAHDSGDEGFPPCPNCEKVLEWRPTRFAIGGSNESKAAKIAQDVMEQDFGLTNYKDNSREGDVGYIDPTRKTAAEKDAIMQRESEAGREVLSRMKDVTPTIQKQADSFFGGQMVGIGQNKVSAQQLIAAGKSGPGAEVNPMAALHKLGQAGKLPNNARIIARSNLVK
jgi:hypothetical protein